MTDRTHAAFLFAFVGMLLLFPSIAVAQVVQKEKTLGRFGAWQAYAYQEGGQKVCYMVSVKAPKGKGRTSYVMITHRPIEASLDVFSYGAGAPLDSKHGVKVKIGADSYDLFSVKDTAWARDARTDHKLAGAVNKGATVHVTAISAKGKASILRDTFSLTGSASAYRAISRACGLPEPKAVKKPEPKKRQASTAKGVKKPTAANKKAVKPTEAKKNSVNKKAAPKKPSTSKNKPK